MPWLTLGMMAVLLAVFLLEVQAGGNLRAVPIMTLEAMGGLSRRLAGSGQWFRLLTAPLLHSGVSHLAGNCIALGLSGFRLERLIGRAWMFSIFATGALAGAIASLLSLPSNTVTVGASGAIMAVVVALFMTSFRMPASHARSRIQIRSAVIAVPALLPIPFGASGTHLDYGAHLGGATIGLLLGFLLLLSWERTSHLPGLRPMAAAFAAVALLGYVGSAYAATRHYASFPKEGEFVPRALYPHTAAETAFRAAELVAAYPHDPVAHLFAAQARLQRADRPGAERELTMALALVERSPAMTRGSVAATIRGTLALTILEDGHRADAVKVARMTCMATGSAAPPPEFAAGLVRSGLCPKAP